MNMFRFIQSMNKNVCCQTQPCGLDNPSISRHLKWYDLAVIGFTEAAQGDRVDGTSTGDYAMTMAPYGPVIDGHVNDMNLLGWSTNEVKQGARSSLCAESQQACNFSGASSMDTR